MRDIKFWREEAKKNTDLWKGVVQANQVGDSAKTIAGWFDTSEGIIKRLRMAGLLEKRLPGVIAQEKEHKLEDFEPKKKKSKEEILADLLEKEIKQTSALPGLPKIVKPPKLQKSTNPHKEESQVVLLSDCHPGVKTKTFNTDVFMRRMENFTRTTLRLSELHRQLYPIRNLYVFCLGDLVNGEKVGKNVNADEFECSVYHQIYEYFSPAMLQFLTSSANTYENVYVHVVRGNHGSPTPKNESAYSTNWDIMAMMHVKAMMREVENVHIDIEIESSYKIVEVKGHYFLLTHGDGIPMHMTVPFYGMTTRALRMRSIESMKGELVAEVLRQVREEGLSETKAMQMLTSAPFSYFCTGHFHTVNRFDFSSIEFLTNGTFKSDDQYVLNKMGMGTAPSQVTFGVSAKRGITWYYKMQVDR